MVRVHLPTWARVRWGLFAVLFRPGDRREAPSRTSPGHFVRRVRRSVIAVLSLFALLMVASFVSLAGTPPGLVQSSDGQRGTVEWDPQVCAEMSRDEGRVCDYGQTFNLAGQEHDVDPRLLAAVAYVESGGFSADVIACERDSPDGAQGLMQFMPATAAEREVDPCDPSDAIYGAADYLREMYDDLDDWELGVAGYNAGPYAVQGVGGIPQNGETERYVPQVMEKWDEYRQLFPGGVGGCPQARPSGSTAPVDEARSTRATLAMANAMIECFGRGGNVGCYSPRDGTFEHPRGRACDFMVSERSQGDAMAEWAQANAEELDVLYVIWWRRWWNPTMGDVPWEQWEPYDGASPHTDHVHVSVRLLPGDPGWAACPHDQCTEDWG